MKTYSLILACVLAALAGKANTVAEKFTTDPALDGWQTYGDTNLFQWDSTNQNLDVTWDSSQTNSYYYHPLGVTMTTNDSFCVVFDLNISDVNAVGYFEMAIGLCNYADSTSGTFSRANVISPNLFEFDYFPDGPLSYGPSIDGTLVDSNSLFYYVHDESQALPTNTVLHVILFHQPNTAKISGVVITNGQILSSMTLAYSGGAAGFALDTLAISSYTTLDDSYGDSLLAHGTVDNLTFATPIPVGVVNTINAGQMQFGNDTNWVYKLEQTTDFQTWSTASPTFPGNGTNMTIQATNQPAANAFYRVRADLP